MRFTWLSRPHRCRSRGGTALELALVLPALIALTMGSIEFGYFLYAKNTTQSAARDGARTAITSSGTQAAAVASITRVMTAAGMQNSGYTTTFVNTSTGASISDVSTIPAGTGITVNVNVTFGALNVRPLGWIPTNKLIVGTTTMTKE